MAYASPTEWINTMLDFSSMKLEKVYSTTDPAVEYPREFYINHSEPVSIIPTSEYAVHA